MSDELTVSQNQSYDKVSIVVDGNQYKNYIDESLCDTLEYHGEEVKEFDINTYRTKLNNYSLNSLADSEKLYWIVSTSDGVGSAVDDTDIIGMYISALNKYYKISLSSKQSYSVEDFNQIELSERIAVLQGRYFFIDFSPAVSNWNQNMKLAGPVFRIALKGMK